MTRWCVTEQWKNKIFKRNESFWLGHELNENRLIRTVNSSICYCVFKFKSKEVERNESLWSAPVLFQIRNILQNICPQRLCMGYKVFSCKWIEWGQMDPNGFSICYFVFKRSLHTMMGRCGYLVETHNGRTFFVLSLRWWYLRNFIQHLYEMKIRHVI